MSELKKTKNQPAHWSAKEQFLWALSLLALYLDDLLFVAAGVCFTAAAGLAFGRSAALAVAGVCLLAYGIVVARARNGGDDR